MQIGFIGIGLMGFPMAKNLLKSGYKLKAFNRSQDKAERLKEFGAEISISIKDAVTNSDIIITMLTDDDAVERVMGNDGFIKNIKTNATVIDMSSINPALSKKYADILKKKDHELFDKIEKISGKIVDNRKNSFPGEVISDFLQENKNYFPKLEQFANKVFDKIQKNNRTRYIALCDFLKSEYSIIVKDIIPEEGKPFSKIYNKDTKELLLSDYNTLETKKLHAASQIAQEGASKEINEYLSNFNFPSNESKRLTQVALLNYCGAAILMPYKLFHTECKELKYDLELLQNTFATSFEQVAHRVTCLQNPKLPGIPFHMLRTDIAGNISKRFSLSGIEIPRYGGACPRWNVYSAFTRPGIIQAAVSKMTNGEKYVCIARTVEKGVGRYGQSKSILSIGLGCEAKYAKEFVYTENVNINDKSSEIPIGVSCRTCDRFDCSQRAFPPLHKKFDVDLNSRGVSVYVSDSNS